MKKATYTFLCLFVIVNGFAQSPGGVGAPTLWLRGTAGTSSVVNGTVNTTWTSGGSVAASVTQATNANRPLFRDGSGAAAPYTSSLNVFNYNPYLFFDGVNDNLASTTSYNFGSSSSAGSGLTQFAVVHPNNTAGIVYFEWNGPNAMVKCKSDGPQCLTNGGGNLGTNNQYNVPNNTTPRIQHIEGFDNGLFTNIAGANGFSGYNHIPVTTLAANNNPSGASADRTNVGCNVNSGEFSQTDIAEIIIFNRNLTNAEMVKVNSFLGLKYGITLGGNGSVTDYVSAAGTTIWNSVAAYHNSVIGIGRDDNSGLTQKQSHTDDDSSRVYLSSLASTNSLNISGSFSANNSFIVFGNNTGKLCATSASNLEMPTGLTSCNLYSRLEREWRVQRTNSVENFNWDVKLNSCGLPSAVAVSDLRFLVDDDGNFANGGTSCYYNGDGTGLTFTYSNPVVTVSGISTTHIPNNSFRFITVASINPATPLPIEVLDYKAVYDEERDQADLTWTTLTEQNSDYFTMEVSQDLVNWFFLKNVQAAGNSVQVLNYAMVDPDPELGTNYYRLKEYDMDGTKKYEAIRSINKEQTEDVLVYPNPTTGLVNISFNRKTETEIKVIDNWGRIVQVPMVQNDSKMYTLNFEQFAQGLYTIQLISGNAINSVRLNYIR